MKNYYKIVGLVFGPLIAIAIISKIPFVPEFFLDAVTFLFVYAAYLVYYAIPKVIDYI